jgi:WXG100 family type VII secretion target
MSNIRLTPDQLRSERRAALNNVEHVQAIATNVVNKAQAIAGSWDGPARVAAQKSMAEIADGLKKFSANQTVIADGLGKLATSHEHNEADQASALGGVFQS